MKFLRVRAFWRNVSRRARADSIRIANATEVERAVTGRALPQRAPVDTPQTLKRTELSGSLVADGVLTGNIKRFGSTGTASGKNIVALGNSVNQFHADYSDQRPHAGVASRDQRERNGGLMTAGFNLDSVQAKVTYQKPLGTVALEVHQDTHNTYSANADYTLNKDRNELRLNNLKLRFDSTIWASTHPSGIHWGTAGIDISQLELRNGGNGRIFVNGLLPKQGTANLEVAVDNFAVQDLISLAQSDIDASGLLSFDFHAAGSAADPTFHGAFGTQNFIYNGTAIPELHGTLSYTNQTLTGKAEAMKPGRRTDTGCFRHDSDKPGAHGSDRLALPDKSPDRSGDQGRQPAARSRAAAQHVRHQPQGSRDSRLQNRRHVEPP